jgi:hypothetical protein
MFTFLVVAGFATEEAVVAVSATMLPVTSNLGCNEAGGREAVLPEINCAD